MISTILDTIQEELKIKQLSTNSRFLLAVSGGVDSMVMLDAFAKLKLNVTVAHVNFSLRAKESDEDEALVLRRANELGFPSEVKKVNTKEYAEKNKQSIQVAAREIRYEWFKSIMQEHSIQTLVTAHHLNDSVETFFINLNRGTGIKGLIGIPSSNKRFRPLLKLSKEEIQTYADLYKIEYREDQSNRSNDYERNWIRNEIVDRLTTKNPQFLASMKLTIQRLQDAQQLIEKSLFIEIQQLNNFLEQDRIELATIKNLNHPKEALVKVLQKRGFNENQVEEMLICLNEGRVGKRFNAKHYLVLVDRERLLFELRNQDTSDSATQTISDTDKEIEKPIKLKLNVCSRSNYEHNSNKREEGVDFAKLEFPLELRVWQKGDKMKPLGMKGQKKISDILIDLKVPMTDKAKVLVLTSNKKVVWLVGYRVDDRFKVSKETTEVYKMKWLK